MMNEDSQRQMTDWTEMELSLSLGTIVAGYALVGLVTYFSVLLAAATLRWKESRKKKMFAEMVMANLGERFAMDITFQDIVNNFKVKDDGEENGKNPKGKTDE
jgi:hypothetical protein